MRKRRGLPNSLSNNSVKIQGNTKRNHEIFGVFQNREMKFIFKLFLKIFFFEKIILKMNFISRFWKRFHHLFSIPLYLGRNLFRLEKIPSISRSRSRNFRSFNLNQTFFPTNRSYKFHHFSRNCVNGFRIQPANSSYHPCCLSHSFALCSLGTFSQSLVSFKKSFG